MVLNFGPVAFVLDGGLVPANQSVNTFFSVAPGKDPWPKVWVYRLQFEAQVLGPWQPFEGTEQCPGTVVSPGSLNLVLEHPRPRFRLEVKGDLVRLVVPEPLPAIAVHPTLKLALCFVALSTLAAEEAGVVLHCSGTVAGGKAQLLCGPHGQGKSTTANLLGIESKFVDDLAFVLPSPQGFLAGGLTRFEPRLLPLGSISFLQRGDASALGPCLPASQAFRQLHRRTVMWPKALPGAHGVHQVLERIVSEVPCYQLTVNLGDLRQARLFDAEATQPCCR